MTDIFNVAGGVAVGAAGVLCTTCICTILKTLAVMSQKAWSILKVPHCLAPTVRIADAFILVSSELCPQPADTISLACCGSTGLLGQAYCDAGLIALIRPGAIVNRSKKVKMALEIETGL